MSGSTDAEMIDADDLAMLATGFRAAMDEAPGAGDADAALFELGWGELLVAAPTHGAATAFTELGLSGSGAGLIDDVVAAALGCAVSLSTAVVLPAPHRASAPATRTADGIAVDGLASARLDAAERAILAVDEGDRLAIVTVEATLIRADAVDGQHTLDPDRAYRRVRAVVPIDAASPLEAGAWDDAVAAARAALAHQLVGTSRWMLDAARRHAIDRVQFGRSVASFQAVRHKLADALVQIEGAASVASACVPGVDPLVPMLAKSLAGKAARVTSANAQQVLAGIGFTTDHQFHRWLKRSLTVDTLFGSAHSLPAEIGRELLRRGEAPRIVQL